jgi:hypothetical protein
MAQTWKETLRPAQSRTTHDHTTLRQPYHASRIGSAGTAVAMTADAATALVARGAGAVGLAAIALIHVLDAPGTYDGTRYIFWLYIALIAGCLVGAALLLRAPSRRAWLAATVLSLSPFIGFVLSRSTGLPGDTGDIGNWTEPLGLASLFVEACVCALSLYGLTLARRATGLLPSNG